jgi:ubiquinone/menaquinone biosynthesis C-methylase UbiE
MVYPGDLIRSAYQDAEGFRLHWGAELAEANERLIAPMDLRDARNLLDVGAGVGLGIPHLRKAAPRALVVAVDYVETMIRAVPSEAARACMDAQALGFSDATFDAAVLAFMLFHVPDPLRALLEVRRVLRPHGRLAIGTWGETGVAFPADEVWYRALTEQGAPPLPDAITNHVQMDSPEKMATLLSEAGFTDADSRAVDLVDRMKDAHEYLIRRTTLGVSAARYGMLTQKAKEAVLASVGPQLDSIEDFVVTERAILTWARRT